MEFGAWTFTGFDVVVLIILGFSAILSFARGFSREFISLLALVIGLAAALFVFGRYQISVQQFIKPSWLSDGVLFLSVFGALYLLTTFILRGWAKALKGKDIGFFDRLLGLAYGLARGIVLASLFVLVISKSAKDGEPASWMSEATSYPVLRTVSDTLQKLPFAQAKEIAQEIKNKGEESDILPEIPQPQSEPEQ